MGLTTFPRKRMLWALAEKITTRKSRFNQRAWRLSQGQKVTTAGDHCSLGANFAHLQDGLAEALKGK